VVDLRVIFFHCKKGDFASSAITPLFILAIKNSLLITKKLMQRLGNPVNSNQYIT